MGKQITWEHLLLRSLGTYLQCVPSLNIHCAEDNTVWGNGLTFTMYPVCACVSSHGTDKLGPHTRNCLYLSCSEHLHNNLHIGMFAAWLQTAAGRGEVCWCAPWLVRSSTSAEPRTRIGPPLSWRLVLQLASSHINSAGYLVISSTITPASVQGPD